MAQLVALPALSALAVDHGVMRPPPQLTALSLLRGLTHLQASRVLQWHPVGIK